MEVGLLILGFDLACGTGELYNPHKLRALGRQTGDYQAIGSIGETSTLRQLPAVLVSALPSTQALAVCEVQEPLLLPFSPHRKVALSDSASCSL